MVCKVEEKNKGEKKGKKGNVSVCTRWEIIIQCCVLTNKSLILLNPASILPGGYLGTEVKKTR